MADLHPRRFLAAFVSLNVAAVWSCAIGSPSQTKWRERFDP
jgi:hypothetical protein